MTPTFKFGDKVIITVNGLGRSDMIWTVSDWPKRANVLTDEYIYLTRVLPYEGFGTASQDITIHSSKVIKLSDLTELEKIIYGV